jgi:glycosyltransferase domain-containing protein
MSNLADLTIVILSYQRHSFLIRSMEYWSGQQPTVIILDGTETPVSDEILRKLAPNIIYNWNNIIYEDRLRSVIPMIKTKYVVQLSDDEFFLPKGLEDCIKELEKNNDLVVCVGRCLYCWPRKGRITVMPYYPSWFDILSDSPEDRMVAKADSLNCMSIYGVARSKNWLNCIKLLTEKAFSCVYITETQFEYFMSFQGKSKVINSLQWFRSGENHPKSFKTWDRSYEFDEWYTRKKNEVEIKDFLKLFVKHCISFDSTLSTQEAEKMLKKTLDKFMERAYGAKNTKYKIKNYFRTLAENIGGKFPGSIKYPLKEILGFTKNHFEYSQIPEKLTKLGYSYDIKDLGRVEESYKNFYK